MGSFAAALQNAGGGWEDAADIGEKAYETEKTAVGETAAYPPYPLSVYRRRRCHWLDMDGVKPGRNCRLCDETAVCVMQKLQRNYNPMMFLVKDLL